MSDDQLDLSKSVSLFARDLGVVELTGPDRVSWLQGMVSNDVARLGAGEGCYAAHLSPQGRMISHMFVLADEDALWLELERDNVASTIEELDKLLIMEEVEIRDRSDEFSLATLFGDGAPSILGTWIGEPLAIPTQYGHRRVGQSRVVCGDLGHDLIVPVEEMPGVRNRLLEAGATPREADVWNRVRIEAGLPAYGVDVDRTTTLPELGEKGIDYDKGCYIGQEVVAKIKYIGHVNRRFVGLKLEHALLPAPRSPVQMADKEIGYVTSAVHSARVGSGIALAFVRHGAGKPGTEVAVLTEGEPQPATVVDLPFV